MEFWGVEVKPGQKLMCDVEIGRVLHLSQAALGESKTKGSENVPIFVNLNDQKLVLGTLSQEKCQQIPYDIVFEKEFELSHGSKNASVYFTGYLSGFQDDDLSGEEFSDSDAEDVQIAADTNGKVKAKNEQVKPSLGKTNDEKEDNSADKGKVKKGEPVKFYKPKVSDEDDEDDEDNEVDEDDSDEDEDMLEPMGDSDDEDVSSENEDEATPKKAAVSGQKRSAEPASKTPAQEKKAKFISPAGKQKTGGDGKKGVHIATPHPAKKAGKTPASSDKSKHQTPNSAGSVTCKSCAKSFNSDNALQAHTKAKHSGST